MSWCNSEKFYGQSTEHGLVRHYPLNDGRDQLVINKFNYMKIINITINNFHEIFVFLSLGDVWSARNKYIQHLFF